ncbi:class I SAM-dependent methyltransferase [Pelagicoccus mobilis]|uniref:Class I SAM-dependent methyltransferase n=1 Tax=Pelagicoccus mobilis TaxID=415221 RepID=A0A934S2I0_9BACT|nr:class I SAM-dependent methyltransferase [Pelagicoccus mobilis]MBK1878229.1 class I SAM-dependent methyltransferase [Pelagicoccus mobilis]
MSVAESTSCPVCHSSKSHQWKPHDQEVFTASKRSIQICESCGNAYSAPLPSYDEPGLSKDDLSSSSSFEQRLLDSFLEDRIKTIKRNRAKPPESESLLDIGAGSGAFARKAAQHGYEVTAIEPELLTKNNTAHAESLNLSWIHSYFDEEAVAKLQSKNQSFDCITLWHVLEHFPDPSSAIEQARRLLSPNGNIIVCVPRFGSKQAEFGGYGWTYLDRDHHFTQFSDKGLKQLIANKGLKIDKEISYSKEYDIFGWFQTWLNKKSRSENLLYLSKKKNIPTEQIDPRAAKTFLIRNSWIALFPAAWHVITSWVRRDPCCIYWILKKA